MAKKVEKPETGTELIVVKQLPVIEDQLLAVKEKIQTRVDEAKSLVCTEDNYKQIKAIRAELNKEYSELEKRRKEIKNQILEPYQKFESVYKECAGDLYTSADRELAAKITEVESGLKAEKADDLCNYFYEYLRSVGIDPSFVSVDDAKIKVGLSDSKTSLHKQAAAFIDRIVDDLKVIDTLASRDEVLAEYAEDYNLSRAMLAVENRHKAVEAAQKRREEMKAAQETAQASETVVQNVIKADELPAAIAVPAQETPTATPDVLQTTFTVWGTRDQLKALKAFLEEGGYKYE